MWVCGVARLTRLPVTEKIEGSNPFRPAREKYHLLKSGIFLWLNSTFDQTLYSVLQLDGETNSMRPPYAVYVLEVVWSWDHANTALVTLTIEGCEGSRYEPEFEQLVNPDFDSGHKASMLAELKRIAKTVQRSVVNSYRLEKLYRVEDYDGIIRFPQTKEPFLAGTSATLSMKLKPICAFDQDGNPVALTSLQS